MLYTILQIFAFQALFLLVYDLFLKRETFFNYNRAYLLISSILSLVLPFIKLPELKKIVTKDVVIHLPEVFIGVKSPSAYDIQIAEQAGIIIEQSQTPIWQFVLLTGIAVATLIFLFKISKLYWLKSKNPKRWKGNVLIVKLIKSSAAFSFFNTIFLGERIPETEKTTIYKHELVHIKELHTLDLLFFELLRIIFWFNPLVYIYQNRIKELHEYIADGKAVKQNGKTEYYESLLNQVFDVNNVSFTNTFFKKSLIKKRITMLQKSKSKQLNLLKYTLLIPLVFGMLIYTSTEVRAQEKTQQEKVDDQELTDEEWIKKYYNEYVEMKLNGVSFLDIAKSAGMGKINYKKYFVSRKEYLKSKAYMNYVADEMIQRKTEEGTLDQIDINMAEKMKLNKHNSYKEYRDWKQTDEAKEHWESYSKDGVVRLFVKEIGNQTAKEKKLLDGLLKQLESDDNVTKVILTDGKSMFKIDSYESPKSDKEVQETIEVPFAVVDESPTTFECEELTSNEERKNCMNSFVNKHIGKNFNTSIADSLNPGKKRIFVQFKIDKDGIVKDIKARGPSKELEVEAKRVIGTLPQFVPGRQKGKLVTVPYSLPIVFQIKGENKDQVALSYKELVTQRDRVLRNSSEKNPVVTNLNKQIDSVRKEQKDKLFQKLLDQRERMKTEKEKNVEVTENNQDEVPFSVVEVAPIHPDCVSISMDDERRKCSSAAINKMVNKNFNTELGNEFGLEGLNKIFVSFHITKEGEVDDIKVRAKHPKLVEEAKRVIALFPKFIPGRHNGEAVDVPYSLPIVFQIADSKKN